MSVTIASPHSEETVNSLTLYVSVNYNTGIGIVRSPTDGPPPIPTVPPPPVPPVPPVPPPPTTWNLTCQVVGVPPSTVPVTPIEGGHLFAFTVPAVGDYTINAKLESVANGTTTQHGIGQETPVHVTNNGGGGVIILNPPPPPPPPPLAPTSGTSAKGGTLAATKKPGESADPCPPCPKPFILTGTFPSVAGDPTTGLVVLIYHIHNDSEVIDFVSVPLLVGSTLAAGGSGSVVVGNTFSTVFPSEARLPGRHFRLYLTGILGKILYATSGPVPPA